MKKDIQCEHFYSFPPSEVWRCLTNPELLVKWWAKGDVKAEVGHLFELDMGNFGKQSCQILEVIPEKRLKYSFSEKLKTTITWELIPSDKGTLLKLSHGGFDFDSPMGGQAYNGMKNGWPMILEKMTNVLNDIGK